MAFDTTQGLNEMDTLSIRLTRLSQLAQKYRFAATTLAMLAEVALVFWARETPLGHLQMVIGMAYIFFPTVMAVSMFPYAGRLSAVAGFAAFVYMNYWSPFAAPRPPLDVTDVIVVGCFWIAVVWFIAAISGFQRQAIGDIDASRRRLLHRLLSAEEEERHKIANDLHDDTIQCMTAALLMLDGARSTAVVPGTIKNVERARTLLRDSLERTRTLMFEMAPAVLNHHGLAPALEGLGKAAAEEMGASYKVEAPATRFDPVVEAMVFRLVREAVVNVKKHSSATEFSINCRERKTMMVIQVNDNGKGFDVEAMRERARRPHVHKHLGLPSLIERVELAGGRALIDSAPGKGTQIALVIPTRPRAKTAA